VFLIVRKEIKMRGLKWILLGIYLIIAGLALLGLTFSAGPVIAGVCALVAGILFIINR
jgi:hypothetical protein